MPAEKLLFIDTNIWLDFYRARNDTGLKLLKQVEALTDNLIVTYQLESEFKRNRQAVLMESWDNLKPPTDLGFRTSSPKQRRQRCWPPT
jgi:predicted nucleic acid-binding protein